MKTQEHTGWQYLLKLLGGIHQKDEMNDLLSLLLTHEERHDMANRILIIKGLLEANLPQRELAKKLSVSIAKITRGSNALKTIDERLRNLLINYLH